MTSSAHTRASAATARPRQPWSSVMTVMVLGAAALPLALSGCVAVPADAAFYQQPAYYDSTPAYPATVQGGVVYPGAVAPAPYYAAPTPGYYSPGGISIGIYGSDGRDGRYRPPPPPPRPDNRPGYGRPDFNRPGPGGAYRPENNRPDGNRPGLGYGRPGAEGQRPGERSSGAPPNRPSGPFSAGGAGNNNVAQPRPQPPAQFQPQARPQSQTQPQPRPQRPGARNDQDGR